MKESLFEALKYMGAATLFVIYIVSLDSLKEKKNISSKLVIFTTIAISLLGYIIYCGNIVGFGTVGSYIWNIATSNIGRKIITIIKFAIAFCIVGGLYFLKDLPKLVGKTPKSYTVFFILSPIPLVYALIKYGANHLYSALEEVSVKYSFVDGFVIFFLLATIIALEKKVASKLKKTKINMFLIFLILDIYVLSYFLDVYGVLYVTKIITKVIGSIVVVLIALSFLLGDGGIKRKNGRCAGCPDEHSCTSKFGAHCPRSR